MRISLLVALFCCLCSSILAQEATRIEGVVIDKDTKEPLSFVSLQLVESYTGASTDLDGKYRIDTRFVTDSLICSFIGYKPVTKKVTPGIKQTINFELESESIVMDNVTIKAKKQKYSKKNNPAVALIKKVLANKKKNQLKGQDYYSFDQHEKIQIDINNITEELKNNRLLRSFDLIWEYVDTSTMNGKTYLPLFLRETLSTKYYRRDPESEKEHKHGVKLTKFEESLDNKSIDDVVNILYQDIDIYESTIMLLNNQFLSPISGLAEDFYRFYIIDTLELNGKSVIDLAFIPKNKQDFGFVGDLYISNDTTYSVVKVDMGIMGDINLNFVRDLKITQEFEPYQEAIIRTKDELTIDYSLTTNSVGLFGKRTAKYENFDFEKQSDESIYGGLSKTIYAEDVYDKSDEFWNQNRLDPLNKNEQKLYEMIDTLKNYPPYQRFVTFAKILVTGFVQAGPLDIGPLNSFISFNRVEGARLRIGGETNFNFANKLRLGGFAAYGTRDKRWKFGGDMTYSFNKDWFENPRHDITAGFSRETSFPGLELQYVNEDNFLLSFTRGVTDRMILSDTYYANYRNEGTSMDYTLIAEHKKRQPHGNLAFIDGNLEDPTSFDDISTTELGIDFRLAPNAQFVQGREYRYPIFNEFPILNVSYRKGFEGLTNGEYDYHKLHLSLFKRLHWSVAGISDIELEGGKIWGDVPYLLLHIPRANQTYSYQLRSYNMMNFMEFASDRYVGLNIAHYFKGYIFNKIPLWRKLKLREVITFKMLYGDLSNDLNPNINHSLIQFSKDEMGNPTTFSLEGKPYMEASFGFMNIFKFLRLDFVKRLTQLDNPNIPTLFGVKGLGIRARMRIEF